MDLETYLIFQDPMEPICDYIMKMSSKGITSSLPNGGPESTLGDKTLR